VVGTAAGRAGRISGAAGTGEVVTASPYGGSRRAHPARAQDGRRRRAPARDTPHGPANRAYCLTDSGCHPDVSKRTSRHTPPDTAKVLPSTGRRGVFGAWHPHG